MSNASALPGAPALLECRPTLDVPQPVHFEFHGFVGERFVNNVEQWLLPAPDANPAMLQIFRDRDRSLRRDLVPWAGEFAGKYLTSAALGLRMTNPRDPRLRDAVAAFVRDLIATQDADGYLGPAPRDQRLTGKTSNGEWALWDVWGHYHCMLGLLLWHQETGDAAALAAARKIGDLICSRFGDGGQRLTDAGAEEMNMSIPHGLCLLYETTGERRYLDMARRIETLEWQTPPAGDYVRTALAGQEYWQTPKPRWESLHDIQAIAELYFITGDEQYRKAFEHIWWSIAKGDRHNTGGFTSGEQAIGNPYDPRAIETCCTIAWTALSVDMLRLTGNPIVADEIELSTFNGILGAQHPSGRWWTYNTPMDGLRKASAHEIVFQAREGSPELNCCSVNGPRGLGMLTQWGAMEAADGVVVNYYGPSRAVVELPSGNMLTIAQDTRYPVDGQVMLRLRLDVHETFNLRLRIPAWSRDTRVAVNGAQVDGVTAGTYLSLAREWKSGDEITLLLDMTPHVWAGEREAAGKVSLYRGPILLAYDQRFNAFDPDAIPTISPADLGTLELVESTAPLPGSAAWLLAHVRASDGRELVLCDFASAGAAGNPYHSWLPAQGFEPQPFSREHPVWCARSA
jgi:uncharacterized protein